MCGHARDEKEPGEADTLGEVGGWRGIRLGASARKANAASQPTSPRASGAERSFATRA